MAAAEALELLVTHFDSVQRLQQKFYEAYAATNNTLHFLRHTVQTLQEKETKSKDLNQRLTLLIEQNSIFLARTIDSTQLVKFLKAAAVNPEVHKADKEKLIHQLSFYPTTLDCAPESILFDYLCCLPTASADTPNSRARHIFPLIHPKKTPHKATSTAPLVPFGKEAKIILQNRHLRKVLKCCGVDGVRCIQQRLQTCMARKPSVTAIHRDCLIVRTLST